MRKIVLSCLVILLAQAAFAQDTVSEAAAPADICASAVPAAEPETRAYTAAEQVLQPGVDYRAIFCTDAGAIYVDLLEAYAPLAVNSFVFLSEHGYYNNTTFHRVLANFMAQGGDPTGTGRGGPGYQFADEPVGFLRFDQPGWLAMANSGPDTNGSQFFITTVPYPSLNYSYTIFGEVLEGQENVAAIHLRDPQTATEPGTALNTVVIITDPAAVETTYQPPAPATREEIQSVLDMVSTGLTAPLAVDTEFSGTFDTDRVGQFAPADLSDQYVAFLAEHHHEYRVAHRVTNAACDMATVPFMAISFTLDRFATPEDAAAALNDGFLSQLETASGYTATEVSSLHYPLYTQARTVCDTPATDALTFWQQGHFIVGAQATIPADHPAPPERWLTELVASATYDRVFANVFVRELR